MDDTYESKVLPYVNNQYKRRNIILLTVKMDEESTGFLSTVPKPDVNCVPWSRLLIE